MKKKKMLFTQVIAFGRGEFKQIGKTFREVDPKDPDYDYLLVGVNPYKRYSPSKSFLDVPEEFRLDLTDLNLIGTWSASLNILGKRYCKKYDAIAYIDDDAFVGDLKSTANLYHEEFKRCPNIGWMGPVPFPFVLGLSKKEKEDLKTTARIMNSAPWSTFGMQVANTKMLYELRNEFDYLARKTTFRYDSTTYFISYLLGWDWACVSHKFNHVCHGHTTRDDSQTQYVINGRTEDLKLCVNRAVKHGIDGKWKVSYPEGLRAIKSIISMYQNDIRKFKALLSKERTLLEDPILRNRFVDLNK